MRSFAKRSRVVVIIALFALIAASCGSSSEDTTTTTAAATTTTTEASTTPDETTTTTEGGGDMLPTELAGLNVVDDLTFTVEFKEADPEFPLKLAYAAYFPLPSVAFDDPVAFEEQPIGNGPFEMAGPWEHDVEIPMQKYADYQGPDPAQVDNLSFMIIDDLDTAYNEVLAGNLDVLGPALPTSQVAVAPTEFGDRYGQSSSTSFTYLGFPQYLEGFTADHWKALSMAIDRQLIVDQIFAGTRVPAFSTIPPIFAGAREHVCDNWDYNPEQAKALWDAAGPINDVTVWFNTGGGHEEWVEAVANMWKNTLGIENISFESMEFSEYLPLLDEEGATGPFRLGWGQDYPSPLNFLEPLYASYFEPPVGSNTTFYESDAFDAALAEGKAAVAASGQLADGIPFYQQAEDILCDDSPIAPILYRTNTYVYTEDTDNVFYDSYSDLGVTKVTAGDGEVTVQLSEPEHLFPPTSNESNGIQALRALFTGLVQFDAETNEPFNANAESITSDDGGLTWTVVLKPGWTFHNGEAVTAASYVDAWNYGAYGPNAQQNNSFYAGIVGYDEMNPVEE
ncbi:MAG: ABC transporter substrate-binding protein [Acidimicrobiia bacterium]|jgi:ABC-type oligopeptide transport system substrate-binding subunit